MKTKLLIALTVFVLLGVFVPTATAATPTGAPYGEWVRGVLFAPYAAQMQAFDAGYVAANYADNTYWLKPLLDKTNAKVEKWIPPLTDSELTRYALARVDGLKNQQQADCELGLIRDAAPKFPTQAQFDKCKPGENWYIESYAANRQVIADDFNAGPTTKENEWGKPRNYWLLKNEFCYHLPAARCY